MKKIVYLDTCIPDYFQGFSGETLIAFHWEGQTVHEALKNLEETALNEFHDGETFQAIKEIQERLGSNKEVLRRGAYEVDENGDTGLVHYFGVIENEGEES